MLRSVLLLFVFFGAVGCADTVELVVDDSRSSCEICHRPRPKAGGEPAGIEDAHPWKALSCVACHGGDDKSLDQEAAHVTPQFGTLNLRSLTARELDQVDQRYLQFVNPGDLRVALKTCGESECHKDVVERVVTSTMAHTSGEVTVARYRGGMSETPKAEFGAVAVVDNDYDPDLPGTSERLEVFDPPPVADPASATVGELQDDYMSKSCFRCHLNDFGENKFPGDYRSSGCTACHMPYANNGVSVSADPVVSRSTIPRPVTHQMTSAIPAEQCMHCHYRGGRIGPSYFGFRERAGAGFNPPNPETLGEALHGHDGGYYLVKEDADDLVDRTPPDVHAQAGMTCIDCHTEIDIHGDGRIYGDTQVAIEVRCVSCHGTIDEVTTGKTRRGRALKRLSRDSEGLWWLQSAMNSETSWKVTQIAESMADPSSLAAQAMGRDEDGFSHSDNLRCESCHAAWMPTCYGCHVTMDYSVEARVQTTGVSRPGRPSGTRKWVELDDQVLMRDPYGRIAVSMPAERFFMSAKDKDGNLVMDSVPRTDSAGNLGFGQRTINPHTTQLTSRWSRCDRCHINPGPNPTNLEQVRITLGLGSDRFIETDGAGNEYRLDAIVDENLESIVNVGHPDPQESRPLEPELIRKLLTQPVLE